MPPAGGGGGGQPPGQSSTENHMAPIWIILGVFILGYALWMLARGPIVIAFCYFKLAEVRVFSLVDHHLLTLKPVIYSMLQNPKDVGYHQLAALAQQVGHVMLIPVLLVLGLLSVLLYFRSSTAQYRRTYTMDSLLKFEAPLWPQVTPVLGKDLVGEHIEKGAWAMALTPMQFAKKYKLLKEHEYVDDENKKLRKEKKITVTVEKDKAVQLFAEQLGPIWCGTKSLNIHTRALFAAFAARACNDYDASHKLLMQIAASSKGRLDFSGTNELLAKYENHKLVQIVLKEHAYVLTVMASMIVVARTNGVLATADFLWLKPIDRRLWFMLNSIGRQTAPAEVSGPFAHWLAEKELGRPIKTPMVYQAVPALEEAINEIAYKPDQKEEEDS